MTIVPNAGAEDAEVCSAGAGGRYRCTAVSQRKKLNGP
jgi:hypothetical protein